MSIGHLCAEIPRAHLLNGGLRWRPRSCGPLRRIKDLDMKIQWVLLTILSVMACNDTEGTTSRSGSPGDYCEPTSQGASACQSKRCGTVTCRDTATDQSYEVSACTGASCANSSCPSGSQCVAFGSSGSFCMPTSACDNGSQTPVTGTGGASGGVNTGGGVGGSAAAGAAPVPGETGEPTVVVAG
jgi:hypothetical protein